MSKKETNDLGNRILSVAREVYADKSEIEARFSINDLENFISKLEQEAERRGVEKAVGLVKGLYDMEDFHLDEEKLVLHGVLSVLQRELKLLEEESGKQNAR